MKSSRVRELRRLAGAAAAALALSSCGGGGSRPPTDPVAPGPSTPPGVTQVTGSERIGWNQVGDLGGMRFLAYLDGNPVALDQAACNASAAECSSPMPSIADGMHTIAIAAVSRTGVEGHGPTP